MKHVILLLAIVCSVALFSTQVFANGGYPMTEEVKAQSLNADQISEMQRLLTSQGYDVANVNGVLDVETKAALRQFQEANGLTITSTPTTETLRALSPSWWQQEYFGLSPEFGPTDYSNDNCCP